MSLIIFVVLTLVEPLTCLGWQHCYPCTCHSSSGIKRANCMQVKITSVPQNLSSEIEEIYLSYQILDTLPGNSFVNLVNLQKIFVDRCNLTYLDKNSFKNLHRLTDLSATKNEIRELPATLFQTNKRLKYIWFDNNQVQSFPNGLFTNLTSLNGLYARFNQINYIGPHAFGNNPNLWLIDLTNNQLKRMDGSIIEHLKSVTYLFLHDNQWICDCNLRKLRQIMEQRHIFHRSQPNCSEPKSLQGQKWSNLKPNQFNCWLEFIHPQENITNIITSNHTILSCFITSNSKPIITWFFKQSLLASNDKYIYESIGVTPTIFKHNLTILNLTYSDSGDYTCAANSDMGTINRYFSLTVQNEKLKLPIILEASHIETSWETGNVTLPCKVSGYPQPIIHWINHGIILESTHKYKLLSSIVNNNTFWCNLTILNTRLIDENNYSCQAIYGNYSTSSTVLLKVTPFRNKTLNNIRSPETSVAMLILLVLLVILFVIPIITYACRCCVQHTEKYKIEHSDVFEDNKNMGLINENVIPLENCVDLNIIIEDRPNEIINEEEKRSNENEDEKNIDSEETNAIE